MDKEAFFKRYEFDIQLDRLGGGSFGTVYKAYDNLRDEWKAIKIAEVKYVGGKEFSLIDEFKASEKLPIHKNIANYEAVHQFKMPNGLFDYAIMQYYSVGNLKALLNDKKLNSTQKEEIAKGLINGVVFLHRHNILHRDLKPSNILISKRGDKYIPKIADLGLSKIVGTSDFSEITNSIGGGTLEYSAPEQLLGKQLKLNADIWSLGVIIYQLFLGKIPFESDSITGSAEHKRRFIYSNIVNAPIPEKLNECPEPYQSIIKKCLVKNPNERLKDASKLLDIITNKETIQVSEVSFEETILIDDNDEESKPLLVINLPDLAPAKAGIKNFGIALVSWLKNVGAGFSTNVTNGIRLMQNGAKSITSSSLTILKHFLSSVQGFISFIGSSLWNARKRIALTMLLLFTLAALTFLGKNIHQNYFIGPTAFYQNGLYGFKDSNGKIIIDPAYESAKDYTWGKAKATRNDSTFIFSQDGKLVDIQIKAKVPKQNVEDIADNSKIGSKKTVLNDGQNTADVNNEELISDDGQEFDDPNDKAEVGSRKNLPQSDTDIPVSKEKINQDLTTREQIKEEKRKNSIDTDEQQSSISVESEKKKSNDIPPSQKEKKTAPQELTEDKPIDKVDNISKETTEKKEHPVLVELFENDFVFIKRGNYKFSCASIQKGCENNLPVPKFIPAFEISKFEVTQKEYKEIMGQNTSYNSKCNSCPVEDLTYNDVQKFISKINQLSELYTYRLPTELEWEYAANAGSGHKFSGSTNAKEVAHFKSNSNLTQRVARLKPNQFGLYDMSGNVAEWTSTSLNNSEFIVKGGSWQDRERNLEIRKRKIYHKDDPFPTVGFRLVRTKK